MTVTIDLPPYLRDPRAAEETLANVPDQLNGQLVILLGSLLLAGSAAAAGILVNELIKKRHARNVLVTGVPPEFKSALEAAAESQNVQDRIEVKEAGAELSYEA